jgi:hypothetical protein
MQRFDSDYADFIRMATGSDGSKESAMESIICGWGHQAVWTVASVRAVLESLGFVTWQTNPGESQFPECNNIDGHGKRIGEHPNWVESGVVEGYKPN